MRILSFSALLAIVMVAGGCCMVKTCRQSGEDVCYIENCGWKMFNLLTIASGDPDHPNEDSPLWFENTVTLETNMKLLEREMKKYHAKRFDSLISYHTEEQVFMFLLKRYTLHTSAELLK